MTYIDNFDNQVKNLKAVPFSQGIKDNMDSVLIDVRTKLEYEDGHIPNSILIDIYLPDFAEQISKLNKTKSYYIYCRSGNRSYHAAKYMLSSGFERVFNLENGILDWYEPLEM